MQVRPVDGERLAKGGVGGRAREETAVFPSSDVDLLEGDGRVVDGNSPACSTSAGQSTVDRSTIRPNSGLTFEQSVHVRRDLDAGSYFRDLSPSDQINGTE